MITNLEKLAELTDKELVQISHELLYAAHFKEDSKLYEIFKMEGNDNVTSQIIAISSYLLMENSLRLGKLCS